MTDPETGCGARVLERRFDPRSESPAVQVATAVARLRSTDVLALPPLGTAVDPDALDALVARPGGPGGAADCSATFPYGGLLVSVASHGRITIRELPRVDDR